MKDIDVMIQDEVADIARVLNALHADERGDNENLGRLLILALILIPLIILITVFGKEIAKAASDAWKKVMGSGVQQP